MTIGFAATHLTRDSAAFLIAADCRYSNGVAATDTAIKTHSLGTATGAVVAGNGLSVATAVELTRGIADDHHRLQPETPINFYSTIRLFSFFLNQIEQQSPWSEGCEVVLAGFLNNGTPALAKVTTKPSARTEAHVYVPKYPGSLILFVGQSDGKELIFSSIARAMQEGGPDWIQRAVGTISYLCEHEGERTIGGAPSVAVCARNEAMCWPFVVIGDRTYLRGFDMTASMPPSPPFPGDQRLHVQYDQAWHARADQSRVVGPVLLDQGYGYISRWVDEWIQASDSLNFWGEHDILRALPDLGASPHIVAISRPGELPCTKLAEESL